MRPGADDVTPRPAVTDHDRMAVSVADTLVALSDSERVRALAALPAEALIHMAVSTSHVVRQRARRDMVCDYCAGGHAMVECPTLPSRSRRELRGALA